MKKFLTSLFVVSLLTFGGSASADQPADLHCPDKDAQSKVEDAEGEGSAVLPSGTLFCLKKKTGNTGILTADGSTTIYQYLVAHGIDGEPGEGPSYYIIYGTTSTTSSTTTTVAPTTTEVTTTTVAPTTTTEVPPSSTTTTEPLPTTSVPGDTTTTLPGTTSTTTVPQGSTTTSPETTAPTTTVAAVTSTSSPTTSTVAVTTPPVPTTTSAVPVPRRAQNLAETGGNTWATLTIAAIVVALGSVLVRRTRRIPTI